jgi:hypothetical protein
MVVALLGLSTAEGSVVAGAADALSSREIADRARELPALSSDGAAELKPATSDAIFSGAPPLDGDVAAWNEARAVERAASAKPVDESKATRVAADATSDTYQNSDGTLTRIVHQAAVNFEAAPGVWRKADPKLEKRADGSVTPTALPFDVQFADDAAAPDLVRASNDGWSLAFGLTDAKSSPVKTEIPVLPAPEETRELPADAPVQRGTDLKPTEPARTEPIKLDATIAS